MRRRQSSAGLPELGFLKRRVTVGVVVTPTNAAGAGGSGSAEREFRRASEPGDVRGGFPVSVSADGSSVTADWAPPSDTGDTTITGYDVQVSLDDGRNWAALPRAASDRLDNAPLPAAAAGGSTVKVRVKAVNQFGTSGSWAESAPYRVPEAPAPTPTPTPDP